MRFCCQIEADAEISHMEHHHPAALSPQWTLGSSLNCDKKNGQVNEYYLALSSFFKVSLRALHRPLIYQFSTHIHRPVGD